MKNLSELSSFIESETFSYLDVDIRNGIIEKFLDTVDDLCEQWGVTEDEPEEEKFDSNRMPRKPNLYLGLIPTKVEDMPAGFEVKWVLGGDIQGLIPVVRANGKYGLFRPSFWGMGMGVMEYFGTKNPFKYEDVRICVPQPCYGEYNGYIAVCKAGKWAVLAIDIDNHPLTMVEDCLTFDEARVEMETILGAPSPYPWMTFDGFDENDSSLWSNPNTSIQKSKGGYTRGASTPIKVTFPDGTVYDDKKAVKTFIDTLVKIGLDKVQQVGIMHAGYNLVSDSARPRTGISNWQEPVNGKYIYTKLSNDAKMADLTKISNYYNLGLNIE